MREIKFRIWSFELPEKFLTLEATDNLILLHINTVPNKLIIEQYTGLKDSTGKELYEGDILQINELTDGFDIRFKEKNYEIFWYKEQAKFLLKNNNFFNYHVEYCYYGKIIGNIHENSELLKCTK